MAKTVILANGGFPKKGGEPWKILESAKRVIACDGAANTYSRRFLRVPDYIVGDLDSIRSGSGKGESGMKEVGIPPFPIPHPPSLVCVPDQSTNDLSKAIAFCRQHGWKDLVILGATGKREDHSLGNVFRAMEAGVEVVTDYGCFIPVVGQSRTFRKKVGKGSPISVFATDKSTKMESRGLEWPLNGVRFANLYCATLNRASAATVEIMANKDYFVYIPW